MEEQVIKYLLSNVVDRLYPNSTPEEPVYPFSLYSRNSTEPLLTLCGTEIPFRTDIQIDTWAEKYPIMKSELAAIKAALHMFSGEVELNEEETVAVQLIMMTDEADEEDSENLKFHGQQIFSVYL